jgi:hypothetical protein
MNLPLTIGASAATFVVSFVAWFLAGRRTLFVMRLERRAACAIVWWEDLLPFVAFAGFLCVQTPLEKGIVAVAGATGSSIGLWVAMTVEKMRKKSLGDKML